jgi:hypothetical protein
LLAKLLKGRLGTDKEEKDPTFPDVVFLFYGGVVYRTSGGKTPTMDASLLPLVLVFSPSILDHIEGYYPFDTGAAEGGLYGEPWSTTLLNPLEGYRANHNDRTTPTDLVYRLFGTNRNYIFKSARKAHESGLPPCDLFETKCADGSIHSRCGHLLHFLAGEWIKEKAVDQRYRTIEAHATNPLPLDNLIWIGYPEHLELAINTCVAKLNLSPLLHPYEAFPMQPPNAAAAYLQQVAHKAVIEPLLEPKG